MKRYRYIAVWVASLFSALSMWAQEVIVNVTPAQQVLPPQVLLYLADPGKFFTITLTNTTADAQQVHLGLQLEQTIPSSDLAISTPANRQPQNPFVIQPNSTYTLNSVEMRKLFDHIPSSEIQCPPGLFENYQNGAFGLLPEGTYRAKVTAYRWNDPQLVTPITVSNPEGGWCTFQVCYKAQAPQFLMPVANAQNENAIAEIDPLNAQFAWTQPVIACGASANFTYDFKIVELMPGQQPDVAMDHNPVVYQVEDLMTSMCMITTDVLTRNFYANKTYLAQVTAVANAAGPLSYVMLENNGKSTYHVFKIKTDSEDAKEPEQTEEKEDKDDSSDEEKDEKDEEKNEEKDDNDGEDDELIALWGKNSMQDSLFNDALYNFRNPTITSPAFIEIAARKQFLRSDMAIAWREVWHLGGEGQEADTLTFDYEVQLFNGKSTADKKATLETEPIYTNLVKGSGNLIDTIHWEKIKDKVEEKDYLVLRVKPICTNNANDVAFHYDSLNVVDFALVESLSKKYFQCSNMVEIDNEKPTTASADDLTGQTVAIGEYQLTIDEIKEGKKADTWEGKGRVEWNPLGTKVMVCVKFEDLKINTDLVVFDGTAKSYSNDPKTNNDIVEGLFSDWGIDNLIADTGIPYAEQLQSTATDGVKGLAEKIDLSKYYEYVVAGENIWNAIGSQNIDELYLPIGLPDNLTAIISNDSTAKNPVDIQISTMKFAATHATMDLIGEFVLPNNNVTKDQILVFGCPRLCISPERILPESGTLALLSDLTLYDPESDFTFTFKAPKDVLHPVDGCYISWHADKFEMLGIDADMAIPELRVDSAGVMTDRCPVLNVRASFSEWEDWMIDNVTMEPFQAVDMPGWTFTASDIVYDHSIHRNSTVMGKFPEGYDKSLSTKGGNDLSWKGLYIDTVSVQMPGALTFGDAEDERCKISATNMFFDDSGATLKVAGDDILSARTGKAGGWSFEIDHISLGFIQNNFNDCHFKGKFDVPLIDSEIGYKCQIVNVKEEHNAKAGDYAYIFSTQQVEENVNFDFFVAKAKLKKELTYLLVEAVPEEKEELETRVEFLMGGTLEIGGKEHLQGFVDDIGLEFSVPDVHFAKMRLANCDRWESKYEKSLQDAANQDIKNAMLDLYQDKQFQWGSFYFNTGDWSLASEEKFLGPFSFSLTDYDFNYENNELGVYLQGNLKFVESIELSASAGLEIKSTVSGIEEMDFSKISLKYKEVEFKDASFSASFGGMKLEGSLAVSNDTINGKGFAGTLLLSMPGDLFELDAKGGYYELPEFTWGYFDLALKGQGLRFDPIVMSGVHGGFYFNCIKESTSDTEFNVKPQNGVIGVILGLTISTSAGEDALSGTFEMTVAYDSKNDCLTRFMFTGDLKAVGGLVDAKATILYEYNDMTQYFALNITAEAGLSGEDALESVLGEDMKGFSDKLSELNDKFEGAVAGVKAGLGDLADDSDDKVDKEDREKAKAAKEQAQSGGDKGISMKAGHTSITIDLRITMKEEGKDLDKVKWHLYIGEPADDKRCEFILIDFKSPIVTVNIGANAYLCLGNELPNDGELPPIHPTVQGFLDGSEKGAGVKSDDTNKANRMRTRALENFKADVSGGIMLGAAAWGMVDVDLGLFYGNMTAIGGFDLSLRHMTNMTCMNFDKDPGYHGWYGEGQIYAYLAAVMGLKLDLGFWEGEFPILDAGIGGVFRMGGINPNYFTGAARVKLKAFAGLVDINRKFEFECGDVCDLFYGNALDNFELFGECSLGDTIKDNGWGDAHILDPYLDMKPSIETLAPLDEHFRVIDETEYQRMLRDWEGDAEALKAQANRTFVFHKNATAVLYEYNSDKDSKPAKTTNVTYDLQESFRTRHALNMFELNPNKFYKLDITGYAKELHEGVEDDPRTYNTETRERKPEPWIQTRSFYFRTGTSKVNTLTPDSINLQDYVALAYPSSYGDLTTPEGYVDTAYVSDIQQPIISLKRDLSTAFPSETYKFINWTLCDENGKELETIGNKWTTGDVCVMTPNSPFTKVEKNKTYYLKARYWEYGYDTVRVEKKTINTNTPTAAKMASALSSYNVPKDHEGKLNAMYAANWDFASDGNRLSLPAPMDDNAIATSALPMRPSGAPQIRRTKPVSVDSVSIKLNTYKLKISKNAFNDLMAVNALTKSTTGEYSLTTAKLNAVASVLSASTLAELRNQLAKQSTASGSTTKSSNITMNRQTSEDSNADEGSGEKTLFSNVDNDMASISIEGTRQLGSTETDNQESTLPIMKKDVTTNDEATGSTTNKNNAILEGVTAPTKDNNAVILEGVTAPKKDNNAAILEGVTVTEEKVQLVLKKEITLVNLKVHSVDGNWQTGYKNKDKKRVNTSYEVPFLGIKISSALFNSVIPSDNEYTTDAYIYKYDGLTNEHGYRVRSYDPYWRISYWSNFAFIGGWRINADALGVQATTSQSLIYTDLGGVYEGYTANDKASYRIKNEIWNLRQHSLYVPNQYYYPLPIMEYDLHAYREGGDPRTPVFVPGETAIENLQNAFKQLTDLEDAVIDMDTKILSYAAGVNGAVEKIKNFSLPEWVKAHAGVNMTVSKGAVKLEVPYYQFGLLWGSQFPNSGDTKKFALQSTLKGFSKDASRAQLETSQNIWLSMTGLSLLNGNTVRKQKDGYWHKDDYIKSITYEMYRVNAYNCKTRKYEVKGVHNPQNIVRVTISNPAGSNPKVQ